VDQHAELAIRCGGAEARPARHETKKEHQIVNLLGHLSIIRQSIIVHLILYRTAT
jgi:hypothetical protein